MARRGTAWDDDMGWIAPDPPEADDVVDLGGSRWRLSHVLVLAMVVLAAIVSLVIRTSNERSRTARTQSTAPFTGVFTSPEASGPAVVTTTIGRPLLPVPAGWELFARGPEAMVRVQLAAGKIIRTIVPQLDSSGPVSFVVGPDRAIVIRSLDLVGGYEVRDGKPAHDLSGVFGAGGVALPGPDRGHLWLETWTTGTRRMTLVGFDGRPTHTAIPFPPGGDFPTSDATGYMLFELTGGVYRATPSGMRRVTAGQLLAAGPTRWLTFECGARHHCTATVINRITGQRRTLPASLSRYAGGGMISPDGRTAALYNALPSGNLALHLIDLASGSDLFTGVILAPPSDIPGPFVWSPDSRWLFAADSQEQLTVVDSRTGRRHFLGVVITGIRQVAFRTSS